MIDPPGKYLLLHGSIVLLVGLLSGSPMGNAINKRKGEETIRGWRVAHSGLVMGGLLLLVMAVVVPHLGLSSLLAYSLVGCFVVSGYGFVVALPLGAWKGHRGLKPNPRGINHIVYAGNIIGALGSLLGTLILVYGTWNSS